MLFLTYSLLPGTGAELGGGGNTQNSNATFEEGAYAGKTPRHSWHGQKP